MTNQIECLTIGNLLPHGALQEITEKIESKIGDGKLECKAEFLYQIVTRTMSGGVKKMKPVHESIVKEAKKILKRHQIEIPK